MKPNGANKDRWVENSAPDARWPQFKLGQIWTHRELVCFFALRDLKVRYKQAFLGVAWAGLQPLIGAVTFTVLFHRLAKIDVGDSSYFAFALVGFAVWTYMSGAVSAGTHSLTNNAQLLTKVAFPKIVAPVSVVLPGLIDLAVGVSLALAVAIISGDRFSTLGFAIGLPLGVLLMLATIGGPMLFFSASIVKYRDAAVIVSFGLQVFQFASPVAYPPELVPGRWRTLLYLNPVAGCLGLFRSAIIGATRPSTPKLLLSGLSAVIGLVVGLIHFRRHEREFADII